MRSLLFTVFARLPGKGSVDFTGVFRWPEAQACLDLIIYLTHSIHYDAAWD